MEWTTGIVISLIGLLAGGVGHWVTTNNKITRLETKVEALEKGHSEIMQMMKDGFESMRRELKDDLNSIKEYMKDLIDRR